MARKNPDYEDSEMDSDDETAEDINNLCQEATMPLSEVLEKYKGNSDKIAQIQTVQRLIAMAPSLKIKKTIEEVGADAIAGPGPSSSSSHGAGGSSSSSSSAAKPSGSGASSSKIAFSEDEVSSSSAKVSDKGSEAEPSSSSVLPSEQAPDSTHTIPVKEHKETESTTTTTSSSSISTPAECSEANAKSLAETNGDISESKKQPEAKSSGSKKKGEDDAAISSSSLENGDGANSCPSSTSSSAAVASSAAAAAPQSTAAGSSISSSGSSSSQPAKRPKSAKLPDRSSNSKANQPDTESDSSSDDENDTTFKLDDSSSTKKKPLNSEDDTTDEEGDPEDEDDDEEDDDELSNEEMSDDDEENEDEDGLDDDFMNNMETGPGKASGCTAVVAVLAGRDLYVANAGDSRCIVCRNGKVVEMSFDHKPEDEPEFERIRKAGGRVTLDGRVNGGLNLSRAIGDHGYKMNEDLQPQDQMISAMPDIKRITLNSEDEFMVLACDGIWNYMSNEEVAAFVKQRIDSGKLSLAQICEEVS